jgi:hypothetical protein
MSWLYFFFVQSVFVFCGSTLTMEPQTFVPAATKKEKNAALAAANRAVIFAADPKAAKRMSKPRKLNTEESLTGGGHGTAVQSSAPIVLETAWFQPLSV